MTLKQLRKRLMRKSAPIVKDEELTRLLNESIERAYFSIGHRFYRYSTKGWRP